MNLSTVYRGPNSVDPPRLALISDAAAEPLTVAEAKLWLRIDTTREDSLIAALIKAARLHFEAITGVCIISQQWGCTFATIPVRFGEYGLEYGLAPSMTRFVGAPNGREFVFPRAPLISFDEFKYIDGNGTLQVFDTSPWAKLTVGSIGSRNSFGRIWLNDGIDWPDVGNYPNAMQFKFTAGMAPDQASVTEDVKQAIRWLVAHYYENRLPVGTGDSLSELPLSLRSYIEQFRVAFIA